MTHLSLVSSCFLFFVYNMGLKDYLESFSQEIKRDR